MSHFFFHNYTLEHSEIDARVRRTNRSNVGGDGTYLFDTKQTAADGRVEHVTTCTRYFIVSASFCSRT